MGPPEVAAAIVAGVVSLLVTFGKVAWDGRAKRQERRLTAQAELNRYREPLLSAVAELGDRIDNIRNKNFLSFYLRNTERRQTALRSTSFRIAQYFAWKEILYAASGQYRLAANEETKGVDDKLGWVASTFATDAFDRENGSDAGSSRLMLWREEQRGIGELMRQSGDTPACVGYSEFVKNYDNHYSDWFVRFECELKSMFSPTESKPDSQRLNMLQGVLAELLLKLDTNQSVVKMEEGKVTEPKWARQCRYPEPNQYSEDVKNGRAVPWSLPVGC
jgi:hypothetical protein